MNNPLEFLLRKQKMAQGGRIRLGGGGTMGSEDRGYQGRGDKKKQINLNKKEKKNQKMVNL